MKLDADMVNPGDFKIYDCTGIQIPGVISYDTDTKEIKMLVYLPTGGPGRRFLMQTEADPFIVKAVLPNSYAVGPKGEKL